MTAREMLESPETPAAACREREKTGQEVVLVLLEPDDQPAFWLRVTWLMAQYIVMRENPYEVFEDCKVSFVRI